MASTFALSMTKWALDVASSLIKADVRLHNFEAVEDDMSIIFTVNHFTRLETLLLPYTLHQHTGLEVWSLAAADLFRGRIGRYLENSGAVSTKDPDRDTIITRSLLDGAHPWIIFPEGRMVKDKKVVSPEGEFEVWSDSGRRPPHTGAAVLALRAEFYRHKLHCIADRPGQPGLEEALARFELNDVDEVLRRRTVVIPVNITYFPIRARDNFVLRMATRFAQDLSTRAMEELSVEGTVLSEDTDIDITLGTPIDVREYLNEPQYAEVMACGVNDMQALEEDPGSQFNDAARRLMRQYMADIYQLTTVNYDHILATLIRYQESNTFTERAYRNRIFLAAHEIVQSGRYRVHELLQETYRAIVYEDPSPKFDDFVGICLREGVLRREGEQYVRTANLKEDEPDFHEARWEALTQVIANEIEPLTEATDIIRRNVRIPRFLLSKRIRDFFLQEDQRCFEEDYARFYDPELSKGADVGRPFLLKPLRPKAGIVLSHGYMAAPLEVRAMAEYFYRQGYAVYGVRLAGHGTSPADLAQTSWEAWYESFNRGYAVIKSLTDNIFLGGFSTGGCIALIAAARKGVKIQGVFSICAPLQVRSYSIRLAPSIVSLNSLLKRMGRNLENWEFVENVPENAHINYTRNPLTGVRELVETMDMTGSVLQNIQVPTLVLQASKDTVVNPVSGQQIFDKVGSSYKELTVLERDRHGIINGPGKEDVFARVHHFLERAPRHETTERLEERPVSSEAAAR